MRPNAPVPKTVPAFFLYGEPRRSVGPRFLHLEPLEERCRPTDWTIRPHAHADLHHMFLIEAGLGDMAADGGALAFQSPCLLTVPARVVHGFRFERETRGQVLTLSHAYLQDVFTRAPEFAGLFAHSAHISGIEAHGIGHKLGQLARELSWSAPGHAAAVDACLLMILVEALRLRRTPEASGQPPGRAAELVARYRELVEQHYRGGATVAQLAVLLGATQATLRRACRVTAGCSPVQIILERQFLEAQRLLLYTSMTVAEVGFGLGFDDTAYFSRFFSRHAGRSPRAFRQDGRAG